MYVFLCLEFVLMHTTEVRQSNVNVIDHKHDMFLLTDLYIAA